MYITRYHSIPRHQIQRGKTISLELECRVPYGSISLFAEEMYSKIDNIILERDGSLDSSEGVEVVFSNKKYELLKEEINIFSEIAKKYNVIAHNAGRGYGIHISISRKGWRLDNEKCAKIVMLIDNFREFFELVGQRKGNQFCVYGPPYEIYQYHISKINSRSKYCAVSFRDYDRIEFRFFRSNIRKERIFKCVETVISIIEYIKTLKEEKKNNLEEYIKFIFRRNRRYENLFNFLLEKEKIINYLINISELNGLVTKELNKRKGISTEPLI
ncbi:MAG: hypothetical protein QXT71_05210 [Thermoplasmata archaeon]